MSNPRKRTQDERVPTLIYSATGHNRIAKLFTEDSLDQIKENLRKRFGLGSTSDFNLLYETDITLVDDDDFAAFEAHAHSSAVAVNVIVNILPHAVATSPTLVPESRVSGPPAKKRRVAAPPSQAESTPPAQKNSAPTATETVPTVPSGEPAPVVGVKRKKNKQATDPPLPTSADVEELPEQERPKKKLKKVADKELATASTPAAEDNGDGEKEPPKKRPKKVTPVVTSQPSTSAAEGAPEDSGSPEEQVNEEPPQGPTKKVTGRKRATTVSKSATAGANDDPPQEPTKKAMGRKRASTVSAGAVGAAAGDQQADAGKPTKSKTKSKKDASDAAPPKSSKKSKPDAQVSEEPFTFPEDLANAISVGGKIAEDKSVSVKPSRKTKKKKASEQDVVVPLPPESAQDPAVAAYLKSLIDGIQYDKESGQTAKTFAGTNGAIGVDTLSCPVCQTTPFHLQYRCPIVLAGSDSIKKRIAELQDDPTDRSELIQQLRKLVPKSLNGVNTAPSPAFDDKRSVSSDDESDPPSFSARKPMIPPLSYSIIDAELDAVINGPPSARLAAKDIVSEDEDEGEDQKLESIILENDDDDIAFRRRSRKLDMREDSSDEEEGVDNLSIPDVPDSPQSSATQPLKDIDIHQSQVPDFSGDKAVDDAMASDNVLFPTDVEVQEATVEEDRDDVSEREATPRPIAVAGNRSPSVIRSHTPTVGQDDPIQPADGFPPTPVGLTKTIQQSSPSTPKVTHKMKDRNGKTPVRLSQLEPPTLPGLPPRESTPVPSTQKDTAEETPAEDKAFRRTRATRSTTRMSTLTSIPPPEKPAPTKRTRGPNKTPEQRAQEEAAKVAAKEEKARLKAQAKTAGKGGKKGAKIAEQPPTNTPISTTQWTVLPPASTSPPEEHESMRDELRSSSPENREGAPLFLPGESQVPFPYSQWTEEAQKSDSEDEEEEEVAKAVKTSSQRPATAPYRRLTDIASQPMVFSSRPTLRPAAFPSSSFPRDKRRELYGTLAREEDESDSDSEAGDEPSHIPKSRQAGTHKRKS